MSPYFAVKQFLPQKCAHLVCHAREPFDSQFWSRWAAHFCLQRFNRIFLEIYLICFLQEKTPAQFNEQNLFRNALFSFFSLSHQLNLITIMFPPTRLLDCRGEIWSLSQKFCKVFINIIIQTKSTYHIYYYILQGVHPYIHSDENNIFF